jgi:hypothetical protein
MRGLSRLGETRADISTGLREVAEEGEGGWGREEGSQVTLDWGLSCWVDHTLREGSLGTGWGTRTGCQPGQWSVGVWLGGVEVASQGLCTLSSLVLVHTALVLPTTHNCNSLPIVHSSTRL